MFASTLEDVRNRDRVCAIPIGDLHLSCLAVAQLTKSELYDTGRHRVAVNDSLSARSPADDLLDRLSEPKVVAAIDTLLDHIDLLAMVAVALDGVLSRGDVIANSLAEAVGELRGSSINGGPLEGVVDLRAIAGSVGDLAGPLSAATPALTAMLTKASQPETLELIDRLLEPRVVASLSTLLDHADLVAVAVVALDGVLSRSDVIANSLSAAVGEFRGASVNGSSPLGGVDFKTIASSVGGLAGPLSAATPALTAMLAKASAPQTVEVVSQLSAALAEVNEAGPTENPPAGVFALMRTLKDPDVSRGIDFFVQMARALGRQRVS